MAIKEYDNQIYTNDLNDPIKKYLLNIIQRYFEIEKNVSQVSKEAMIVQAFTRLKEYMFARTKDFVIGLNERGGEITLTISDFGGEEKINKKTAFNKDFCTILTDPLVKTLYNNTTESYDHMGLPEADHIVEGNDSRLYDAREPIYHVHTIEEIRGLQEKLDQINSISKSSHYHANINVLNLIKYTGSMVEIDLILIDELKQIAEQTEKCLEEVDDYAKNIYRVYTLQFKDLLNHLYTQLVETRTQIDAWMEDWQVEFKQYVNGEVNTFDESIRKFSEQYLTKEEYLEIKEALEKAIYVVDENTFDIGTNTLQFEKAEETVTEVISEDQIDGYTMVYLKDQTSHRITDNTVLSKLNNNINNGNCKLFFEYTEDNKTHKIQLPCLLNHNQHDAFYIYGNTDSNNKINIYVQRLSYIPVCFHSSLQIKTTVSDYCNNTNGDVLVLTNQDLTDKTNGAVQDSNYSQDSNADGQMQAPDGTTFSFRLQKIKSNNSLDYYDQCKISVPGLDTIKYTCIFVKKWSNKYTVGNWQVLNSGQSFSSDDDQILRKIYEEGDIYTTYGTMEYHKVADSQRTAIWTVTNGTMHSTANRSALDVLFTKNKYVCYRHKCTLTVTQTHTDLSQNGDDDAIAIVLSAFIDANEQLHTLSLVCTKRGNGMGNVIDSRMLANCSIILDYKCTSSGYTGTFIGSFSHDANNGEYHDYWIPSQKINFDIKKDSKNIYISTSGFYSITDNSVIYVENEPYMNVTDFVTTDSSIMHINNQNNKEVVISLTELQNKKDLDFRNGHIGYGNISTMYATVVGINFKDYSASTDTEYIDSINDMNIPVVPKITGKCLESNLISGQTINDSYSVTIDASDMWERADYRFYLFEPVDWSIDDPETTVSIIDYLKALPNSEFNAQGPNNGIPDRAIAGGLFDANDGSDHITTFTGIKDITVDDTNFNILSSTKEGNNKLKLVIRKSAPNVQNKIIFCDNITADTFDNIQSYLSKFNCKICVYDNSLKDHLKFRQYYKNNNQENIPTELPDDYVYIPTSYHIDMADKPADKYLYFDQDKYENTQDLKRGYFGEFDFNTLRTYFPNAKIRYQLFKIPNKGENNA